jgi:pimeloyl-ACP methyl ester carboxylesterase
VEVDFADGPPGAPWVHLFHGLEGSSASHYARALMRRVLDTGWNGSVLNFRGCGGEPNRLPRAYHSGDSEEVDWVLRRLKERLGNAPFFAAGISLGGNALLKWLGERGEEAAKLVSGAAAVSAPMDLMAGGDALGARLARLYGRHFLVTLKRHAADKERRFPGLFDGGAVRRAQTLRDFDNAFTAPVHGFRDTDDYWTRSSSKPLLSRIRVPTLLINAGTILSCRNRPCRRNAMSPRGHARIPPSRRPCRVRERNVSRKSRLAPPPPHALLRATRMTSSATPGIPPEIFKAYDIRGIVDRTLTESGVETIGRGLGTLAHRKGVKKFVIGRDGRLSGPRLAQALARGLNAAGIDVVDIGVVATPMVYFGTYHFETGSGVMVTGSHNPPTTTA